jgi:hypothetical protein
MFFLIFDDFIRTFTHLKIKLFYELILHAARQRQTPHGQCHETNVGLIWMGCFEPPPVFHDPAPSDYYLFTSLKKHMGGKKFSSDEEVKETVDKWTKEVAAEFYEAGIKKLICRLTTCIERKGDYVEK